ncbi:ABC transporter ATP-binding protein [Breznakiella homolactica]|uniref:ABC transporter ATP-binding protein n=1 Tax=Breznakiella homolactica TaxID=2798577 RepID=A0A7T7XPG6_9SPIR|nr:ABC transporter ATP-binding protein [Breznakiella homolactica]QQO10073.1 ABC transporter ATP-binding protein [Breznakiella homolactica]
MAEEIPFIELSDITFSYPEAETPVFSGFSGNLPGGFVSLAGPNGIGKSTLMLLAAGRLLPQKGRVRLLGKDTADFADEEERNRFASFVYQNMEFETPEPLEAVLSQVYSGGFHEKKSDQFYKDVLRTFGLTDLAGRSLSKLSKGEMQRTLLAFSVLYGSRSIFMDEPVFALEDKQKEEALEFFRGYSRENRVTVYVSLHELDLTKKYAETVLLFHRGHTIDVGSPAEILTSEALEKAYGVPAAMLRQKEYLDRKKLEEESDLLKNRGDSE